MNLNKLAQSAKQHLPNKQTMAKAGAVVGASVMGLTISAQNAIASVIDTDKLDAHVTAVKSDATIMAQYGMEIILFIMLIVILFGLLKRGK